MKSNVWLLAAVTVQIILIAIAIVVYLELSR